jgi:hypothetical protein
MRALLLLTLAVAIGCGDKNDDTGGEPDGDGDGFTLSDDCDDTDPDINPGAAERCNGVDDDCNGLIDEEGAEGSDIFYADTDGDGFGDENNTIEICDLPEGYVASAYDCDDTRADVNPSGTELCDGADNDCDGTVDEDADDAPTWYADGDGDGYGDERTTTEACDQPDGYVDNADDCDDEDDERSPDIDEVCDGSDNNCDGHIDEDSAVDALTWYGDGDGDGYGNSAVSTQACEQPEDHVGNADDCDDTDDAINPAADETCDDADNDCDGDIDEAGAVDAPTWYADSDGDNFGDASTATQACDMPSGHVSDSSDCDDSDDAINPRATELCDGVDNDCDGDVDADGLVTLDGTTNYSSIGQAVRNASSGGEVLVCDGTYVENVEIAVDLTLASMNGSSATTIDGDNTNPCITVSAGAAVISGFTLTEGLGDLHPENPEAITGGGMQILSTDPVVLDDLVFLNNEADYGAGLFLGEGGTLTMSDSSFDLNDADYTGGGAYFWDATVSLTAVGFEDNFGAYAGGLYVQGGSLDLDACTFEDNYASDFGGGLYLTDEAVVTASTDTLITGNTATDLGGGLILDSGATWTGGEITGNEADFGAGFYAYNEDSSVDNVIEDLLCTDNIAETSGGCGYVYGELSITSSEILDNGALWGGALMLDESTVYLINTTVEENIAAYNGGGVYVNEGSALWSVSSDWGTGSADNDPDDVYVDGGSNSYSLYGSSETFSCSDTLGTCS